MRSLIYLPHYYVTNKHTNDNSEENDRSVPAMKRTLFTVIVCYWLEGDGTSRAKVIRPKRPSCLEGQQQLSTLIKNEWWALWVKGRNGVSVRGIQRGSLWLNCWTRCVQPRGRNQEGNKAVERSLREINHCTQQ